MASTVQISRRALITALGAVPMTFIAARLGLIGATTIKNYGKAYTTLSDAVGVQGHFAQSESAYHDLAKVQACLSYVGIKHMRTAAPQRDTIGFGLTSAAAKTGVKFSFTMRHNRSFADEFGDLELFAQQNPGSIVGVEGPNEIDHSPVTFGGVTDGKQDATTDPRAALAYQAALYKAVKQSRYLDQSPVLAFSDFVQARQQADLSNTHIYPRNGTMLSSLLPAMHVQLDPVKRPIIITEMGFCSSPTAKPFRGTDEAGQASLILEALQTLPTSGVTRMYIYELIDAYPPDDNMDTHFGLFRHDYSPKPAAEAVRRFMRGS